MLDVSSTRVQEKKLCLDEGAAITFYRNPAGPIGGIRVDRGTFSCAGYSDADALWCRPSISFTHGVNVVSFSLFRTRSNGSIGTVRSSRVKHAGSLVTTASIIKGIELATRMGQPISVAHFLELLARARTTRCD